ncbi:MAG: alpha/beta hydrolase-fold protein [Deinococcales bacterium]
MTVHARALEGNLLGDSPDRHVSLYLPAGYDEHPDARYPTVYLLHGYSATDGMWLAEGYIPDLDVEKIANDLIARGRIQPMILVMPHASNAYDGSFYTNSPTSGNWEDFITAGLVDYVDSHVRTLPRPESRAIARFSMGGYGALYLAMRHPETYRAVYGMSPFPLGFEHADIDLDLSPFAFLAARQALTAGERPTSSHVSFAMAAAFSPDPGNPPAFVDLPYDLVDGKPHRIDAVWERWLEHSPLALVGTYAANLAQYRGVALDAATDDGGSILSNATAFSSALSEAGVPHRFAVYEGTHGEEIAVRVHDIVLPFLSTNLEGATDLPSSP